MRVIHSGRFKIAVGIALLSAIGVVGWRQSTPLLCWYRLNCLESATDANRESLANAVAGLEDAAVPGLLNRLARQDPAICKNMEAALTALSHRWGVNDPRTQALGDDVTRHVANFGAAGVAAVLDWRFNLLQHPPKENTSLMKQTIALLKMASQYPEPEIRRRTLALAHALLERNPEPDCISVTVNLVKRELTSKDAALRVKAAHLTLHALLQADLDLLRNVVPLLRDKNSEVRRAALLAVGGSRKILNEEKLLPLLHDTDAEVRRLSAVALRSRGMSDEQILLGRLITDRRASQRLSLVNHLPMTDGIDPAAWLERLSRDPSDAVRAAAIRLAASSSKIDFRRRLQELAQNDPSETVRQLAGYYQSKFGVGSSEFGFNSN